MISIPGRKTGFPALRAVSAAISRSACARHKRHVPSGLFRHARLLRHGPCRPEIQRVTMPGGLSPQRSAAERPYFAQSASITGMMRGSCHS